LEVKERKMIKRVLIAMSVATFLTGCATNSEYYAAVSESNAKRAEIEKVRAQAETARIQGLVELAKSGSEADRASATIALALSGNGANSESQNSNVVAPRKPRDPALEWASVVLPFVGDIASSYYSFSLGETQSNNNRDISISQHEAYTELGLGEYRESPAPRFVPDNSYDLGEGQLELNQ
jgi:hypothetical protein